MSAERDYLEGPGGIEALAELRAAFEGKLVEREGRGRLRRRIVAATAAALAIPVAIAGAIQLTGGSSEPVVVGPGDRVLVGFQDPATGERLTCPDGSLLTKWIGEGSSDGPPRCADGTTPERYTELEARYKAEWDRFFEDSPALTPLSEGPGHITFEIEREGEAP